MTRRRGRRALTNPAVFVQKIWALQGNSNGGTRFVAHKDWDTGVWRDVPLTGDKEPPDMDNDWYFAPCLFRGQRRLREAALPSRLLYADLDDADPRKIKDVPPTLAWETSPGHYQGIWVVDRPLAPEAFDNLNRRLSYHVKADRNGWGRNKVLRIPGTFSTKYGKSRAKKFQVHTMFKGRKRYTVQDLHRLLIPEPGTGVRGAKDVNGAWKDIPESEQVRKAHWKKLSVRARQLLRSQEAPTGERSERLYELEGLLLKAGLSKEETFALVQDSAWNKYRGQRRETRQLRYEITKQEEEQSATMVESMVGRIRAREAGSRSSRNGHDKKLALKLVERQQQEGLPNLFYHEFLDAHFPEPEWLVEGFWGLGAYGVWAGEFKAFKTLTLLDFCVSVASGQPFLGKFGVRQTGPVVYAFDEGTPGYIQDRLRRVAWQKGLAGGTNGNKFEVEFPKHLPMRLVPNPKLNLTDEKSQRALTRFCQHVKPLVLVLESFYLMAQDIDENHANEVTPALSFLKELATSVGTGIIISHHYNKDGSSAEGKKRRSGLRMSGSNVFGRWYESAVYLEREGEETEGRAIITAEHREQKGIGKQHLKVSMDTEDDVHFDVEIVDHNMQLKALEEESSKEKDTLGRKRAPSPGMFPCPICKAMAGQKCKDGEGNHRGYHPSRKKLIETMAG